MALNISKSYTPASGEVADATGYNTDMAALFNAFSGLEAQTSTLGALTIQPATNGTATFVVDDSSGNNILTVDTTNGDVIIEDTAKLYFDGSTAGAGSDTYLVESAADVFDVYVGGVNMVKCTEAATDKVEILGSNLEIDATKLFYLDGGGNTYITESAADTISCYAGGTEVFSIKNDDVAIPATGKLFLDGVAQSGNTYFYESSADNVVLVCGGTNILQWNATNVAQLNGDFLIPATSKIRLDGSASGNTYIEEAAADQLDTTVGGTLMSRITATDVILPLGCIIGAANNDSQIDDSTNGSGSTTLYIGTNTIDTTAPSDERLKENIVNTKDSLDDLLKLRIVDFNFKEGDKSLKKGLIAQEVEKVYPYVINKPDNSSPYYRVEYKDLIPLLIKSIQDLNNKVQALEAK